MTCSFCKAEINRSECFITLVNKKLFYHGDCFEMEYRFKKNKLEQYLDYIEKFKEEIKAMEVMLLAANENKQNILR